jgi:hypothetical protein
MEGSLLFGMEEAIARYEAVLLVGREVAKKVGERAGETEDTEALEVSSSAVTWAREGEASGKTGEAKAEKIGDTDIFC